ncbi:phosphatidylinositol N-acetylglucosaminyltransferase subunit H [Lingula anatina]|uniref:Phosphatidylinositol N-acetylglucosaminyltransferase subunit H n=1 Tax=Lingula anatina TaxID=7574 RepID=A0A1S3JUN7_LINAN|nr:phosphatidylinositol N-acetylglucosaminyltransferase subunit H [Lingula anatina]|eukprot:XP_013414080.1 phosphatidylinositol N-acetylglucosaminyltransferase subunit H [Lingula anatina]
MKDKCDTLDLCNNLQFKIINHCPYSCKEFVITQKFHFRKWLQTSIILNVLAFGIGLHKQDIVILLVALGLVLVILFFKLRSKVVKESLLVMASIGAQTTTTYALGKKCCQFYDLTSIRDIVINEGITMHSIIFYLVLLLRGSDAQTEPQILVPLFKHSWPPLRFLQHIYRESQAVIWKKRKTKDS